MNEKEVFNYLKRLGCCGACCLRYMGVRNTNSYKNVPECTLEYTDTQDKGDAPTANGDHEPPNKKLKQSICVSCLGILDEDNWPDCFAQVKSALERKGYGNRTFACALSAPMATLLREKYITLLLNEKFAPTNFESLLTPLKEAWKWGFCAALAPAVDKILDSGSICPLLITINYEYPEDLEELEPLKQVAPSMFEERKYQKRRFTVEFTRRAVEQALEGANLETLKKHIGETVPPVGQCVKCISVVCAHTPLYLGGRYIKLSRELSQSPWIIKGERMMETSVQEIIFEPIARLYGISAEDTEHRLKFISAGREDVDVRCVGNGRPFAIELSDPSKQPTKEQLDDICKEISKDGRVVINKLVVIDRDDLTALKQGEEMKSKTYEALCIKLTNKRHSMIEPTSVTDKDIEIMNSYRNTPEGDVARINIVQKTPIRVLHRRPLLERPRKIIHLEAEIVPDYPQLFKIRVSTEAGTYIKEWVHGDLNRTKSSLSDILDADLDILALDVTSVDLNWPKNVD